MMAAVATRLLPPFDVITACRRRRCSRYFLAKFSSLISFDFQIPRHQRMLGGLTLLRQSFVPVSQTKTGFKLALLLTTVTLWSWRRISTKTFTFTFAARTLRIQAAYAHIYTLLPMKTMRLDVHVGARIINLAAQAMGILHMLVQNNFLPQNPLRNLCSNRSPR